MPKTLKQMLKGYQPKAADEKKFVDKHVIAKKEDANGNKDDVFNATNVKPFDRAKEHGYNPGEDEKVYEEAEHLDEVSHEGAVRAASVWKNKGDYKKANLYMKLAKALEMNDRTTAQAIEVQLSNLREEEELDEKLKPSMGAGEYISDFEKSSAPQFKGKSKEKRRMMGIAAYLSAKRGMKEEVEELDELKKETLGSYVNKAAVDLARSGHTLGMTKHFDRTQNQNRQSIGTELTVKRIDKRLEGIKAATKKMTKEDVDVTLLELYINLDEENRVAMLNMIDEGRQPELLEFAQSIMEHVNGDDN